MLSGNINLWVKSRRRRRGPIKRDVSPIKVPKRHYALRMRSKCEEVRKNRARGSGTIDAVLQTATDNFAARRACTNTGECIFSRDARVSGEHRPAGGMSRRVVSVARSPGRPATKAFPIWDRRCFALLRFYFLGNSGYDLSRDPRRCAERVG